MLKPLDTKRSASFPFLVLECTISPVRTGIGVSFFLFHTIKFNRLCKVKNGRFFFFVLQQYCVFDITNITTGIERYKLHLPYNVAMFTLELFFLNNSFKFFDIHFSVVL